MKLKKQAVIITLPLGENYGGILQAYSLQKTIHDLGVDAVTTSIPKQGRFKLFVKRIAKTILHIIKPNISNMTSKDVLIKTEKTRQFVNKYIKTVNEKRLYDNGFDAYVVGSDQVWRAKYVKVADYLLGFAVDRMNSVKISYAASFGKDDLSEYSDSDVKESSRLAKNFDSVSVREESGVKLVEECWGIKALRHVDPTMLIPKKHYNSLIKNNQKNVCKPEGELFVYILDESSEKEKVVEKVSRLLGLKSFAFMPPGTSSKKIFRNDPEKYKLPLVEQWLCSFRDANFIITDSFHGCVFSIIYNKPFIAIGNKSRGLSRFTSLLKLFGLEGRLVDCLSEVNEDVVNMNIDWRKVNAILKDEQRRSRKFLKENLNV